MLGYSLNQKGLFGGVVRDPHNRLVKTNTGGIPFNWQKNVVSLNVCVSVNRYDGRF